MSARSVIARGRRFAKRQFTDECVALQETGRAELDPVTRRETQRHRELFRSPCKVKATDAAGAESVAGGRTVTTVRLSVHLPVSAPAVAVGTVLKVTASKTDPQLVGRRFKVTAPFAQTYATARRVPVEEVVA